MSNKDWGGARPNAGRPQEKVKLGKPGTLWIAEVATSASGFAAGKPQRWQVLSVSDTEIEFQNADTEDIITLTIASEYE